MRLWHVPIQHNLESGTVQVDDVIIYNMFHVIKKECCLGRGVGAELGSDRDGYTVNLETVFLLEGRLLGFSYSGSSTRTKAFTESHSTQTYTYTAL